MTINWTSDLYTGIAVIDEQHQQIADYINELDAIIGERQLYLVGPLLDKLVAYTFEHFALEESLLEDAGYHFAKPHKQVHALFAERIAGYQQRCSAGENIAEPLQRMLIRWLNLHIKRDDMAFVSALKAWGGESLMLSSFGRVVNQASASGKSSDFNNHPP